MPTIDYRVIVSSAHAVRPAVAPRRGTWLLVVCLAVGALAPRAKAIGYADFPSELRVVLDERIATLSTSGGVCIAGRVQFSDGVPIGGGEDVQVNFVNGVDAPLRVYGGGWFIATRVLNAFYAGPNRKVVHRAFGYDAWDPLITVLDGDVTYVESLMQRTAVKDLATVVGVVSNEDDNPFPGTRLFLGFPFANLGTNNSPNREAISSGTGGFQFSGLAPTEYNLIAFNTGYAFHQAKFTPSPGSVVTQNRRLYPNRRIVIHYVYQTNGTRSFTDGDLVAERVSWLNGEGGVDFSDGVVEGVEPDDLRDLELNQREDVLEFRNFYVNGSNGFYDAGAVGFETVTEADAGGYTSSRKPVLVGHVYVVRTYEEDHYVKFLVESDEHSFRTVTPGDPGPIVFAGYGLTVDFGFSSGHDQLFVERNLLPPGVIASRQLPFVWQLSGLDSIGFSADLVFSFLDSDLIARRVPESDVDVWRSSNGGFTWQPLLAELDTVANTLTVSKTQTLGWFALASPYAYYFGDADLDDDIDLVDVARMMNCYSGTVHTVDDPACVLSLVDDDAKITLSDVAAITACLHGPAVTPSLACRG